MAYVERSFDFEGMQARYLESGAGFPLLLIHGSGPGASTVGNWRKVLEPLAESFHVFAMDLIGFGRSDRKPAAPFFDMALWLRQCNAMMQRMPGPTLGIIGHSLSGALALKLAAASPRVAAVLTTAAMGAQFAVNPSTVKVWSFPATREELRQTAEVLFHDRALIDDAYLDARVAILHGDASYGPYFSSMFAGDKQVFADAAVLESAELASIKCKVSMLHGRSDVAFPASISLQLLASLPQADLTLLANCSHSIAMEYPQALLAAARLLFRGKHER